MSPEIRNENRPAQGQEPGRRRHVVVAMLAGSLLLAPAATWALPAHAPLAQDETANRQAVGTYQVIAQGIARLPRESVAWTITSGDVPEGAGTEVSAFPLGFAIADASSVAILDEAGTPLSLLDAGEASFLPAGKGGALQSFRAGAASLFQIALVSGEDAAAGNAPGTVVGEPFAPPEGRAFEIELARETLTPGGTSAIPASRSGAPTLLLVTEGAVELASPGGAPVALNAGQFALLLSEVQVSSSGDAAATYLFAAIGDAVNVPEGEARGAARERTPRTPGQADGARRVSGGGGGGGGAARANQPSTEAPTSGERRGRGERVRGERGQGAAATPSPVTGGGEAPTTEGTPAAPVEETPATPSVPVEDGVTDDENIVDQDTTPGEDATEDEVVQDTTPGDDAPEPDVVQEVTPTPDPALEPPAGEEPTEGTTSAEPDPALPADEPVADAPPADAPVEGETGAVDPAAVEEAPAEVPAEAAPAADAPVVNDASGADGAPADGSETDIRPWGLDFLL